MSEGKTFTPILRDGGNPASVGTAPPGAPDEAVAYGGTFNAIGGHVEWIDARSIQSGFTTTFPSNTPTPYTTGGQSYDVDFYQSAGGEDGDAGNVLGDHVPQFPHRRGERAPHGRLGSVRQ